MRRSGCMGLILGSLLGLLWAIILLFLLARQAAPAPATQPDTAPPDVTLFLSERTLSRLASTELNRPVRLAFEPGGQMEVTTRARFGRLNPVVRAGLSVELRGADLVSRVEWLKVGFLTIPAAWLPDQVAELGPVPEEIITAQLPPEFSLAGLETTADGLNVGLNWVIRE